MKYKHLIVNSLFIAKPIPEDFESSSYQAFHLFIKIDERNAKRLTDNNISQIPEDMEVVRISDFCKFHNLTF